MANFLRQKLNQRRRVRRVRNEAQASERTSVAPPVPPKDYPTGISTHPLASPISPTNHRQSAFVLASFLDRLQKRIQPHRRPDVISEEALASFLQPSREDSEVVGTSTTTSLSTIDEADVSNDGGRFVDVHGVRFEILSPNSITSPSATASTITNHQGDGGSTTDSTDSSYQSQPESSEALAPSKREQARARLRDALERRLARLPTRTSIHEALKSSIKKLSPDARNSNLLTNNHFSNTSFIHTASASAFTPTSSTPPPQPSQAPEQTPLPPAELARELSLRIDTAHDPDVGVVVVDVPFYHSFVPARERWTSPDLWCSRPTQPWGATKRWRCCKCGAKTIIENCVCANFKCEHRGCAHGCTMVRQESWW